MDKNVSRRTLLGIVAAGTVATAGCTGESSPGGERMTTETDTPTESPTAASTDGSATVRVRSHPDYEEILVGPEGMTLYMFDQDTQGSGASSCYDGCADNWPPLTVDEDDPEAVEDVSTDLTTFEREDGTMQVAANGWPLYYFAPDEEPGDATGQGANDVWWVLRPDGSPVRSSGSTESGTSTPTETDGRY